MTLKIKEIDVSGVTRAAKRRLNLDIEERYHTERTILLKYLKI